jgi:mRNA-degrading endonuclease RelE of RelBE toxin-antitoxin system
MSYELVPSHIFLQQLEKLSFKARQILKEKLESLKFAPARNKRILGYNLFLFRIRLSDSGKELRIIYLLDKEQVKILCILNRKNNYKDLEKYLRRLGCL